MLRRPDGWNEQITFRYEQIEVSKSAQRSRMTGSVIRELRPRLALLGRAWVSERAQEPALKNADHRRRDNILSLSRRQGGLLRGSQRLLDASCREAILQNTPVHKLEEPRGSSFEVDLRLLKSFVFQCTGNSC